MFALSIVFLGIPNDYSARRQGSATFTMVVSSPARVSCAHGVWRSGWVGEGRPQCHGGGGGSQSDRSFHHGRGLSADRERSCSSSLAAWFGRPTNLTRKPRRGGVRLKGEPTSPQYGAQDVGWSACVPTTGSPAHCGSKETVGSLTPPLRG